jgi:L-lactate utilization protein LutC
MDFNSLASKDSIEKTVKGLADRNVQAEVIKDKAGALERIKQLIPAGASVMNGASTTLDQVGFVEYLKSGTHGWNNMHAIILAEKDPVAQAKLRREALTADYYLGSVHALAETGEFIVASNSGSQLPHLVYSSPNLILVVSTKKIVPTLAVADERLHQHVIPLEDVRMKKVYGPESGTRLSKLFTFMYEPAYTQRKITMLLVEEDLGF